MAAAVSDWLNEVENEPPHDDTACRPHKRKASSSPHAPPQKRFARNTTIIMPSRGKGRATDRIPLNDTPQNTLPQNTLPRRSSRRGSGRASPHSVAPANVFENPPPFSSSGQSQSTVTSTRTRSSSPRKLTTLAALPEPIVYQKPDPYTGEPQPPAQVLRMWEQIKDYAQGRNVLPREMQEEVGGLDTVGEFSEDSFDDSGRRKKLGNPPTLARVEEIRLDTTACRNRRTAPEDVWNDESHVPIGKAAQRGSAHAAHVRWQNVKTADIAPRTVLLPPAIATRPPEAARIDYAIVLEPSERLQAALPYLEPLPSAQDSGWAPTLMADVIHCPFVSVIETKKSGGDPQKAEYQIGIWAYAIFKRLRLLLEANGHPNEPLPCIPLFIAEGEKWELHIASQTSDYRTTIWNFDEIGNALYRKGIYQIIAVKHVVYDWAQTDFREWFECHCLPRAQS